MIKRPVIWMPVISIAIIFFIGRNYPVTTLESEQQTKQKAIVYGVVADSGGFTGDNAVIEDATVVINNKSYNENRLILYRTGNELKAGNHIEASGVLMPLQKPTVFGQFDEYDYYKSKGINAKFYSENLIITDDSIKPIRGFLDTIRNNTVSVYRSLYPERESGIIAAMLLGDKSLLEEDIEDVYKRNGISHILAISGLHISVIGYSVYSLLRRLHTSIILSSVSAIMIILVYGVLTDFSISTERAVIMLVLFLLSKPLGRSYDAKTAISLAAFISLIRNPMNLWQAGFQLSYSAVIGILYLYPQLKHFSTFVETRISDNKVIKKISDMLLLSLSVQIATFPFVIYHFHEYHVYSLFINLLILPLMSLLFSLIILSGITACISMPVARIISGGAYYILKSIEEICNISENLPFHTILIGNDEIPGALLICTAFTVLLIMGIRKAAYVSTILILLSVMVIKFTDTDLIGIIDVGQGDCTVIELPDDINIMYDGGSQDIKNVGKYRIVPYLKYRGIETIDYCFISHTDIDHISGIYEILEAMQPIASASGKIAYKGNIMIKRLVLAEGESDTAKEIIKLATEKGIEILYMSSGDIIGNEDFMIRCISPDINDTYEDINDASMVVEVADKYNSILLTGDISSRVEKKLLESEVLHRYNIVKIAHHGSKYSSSEEFIKKISNENTAFYVSCSKTNRYGHPSNEVIDIIAKHGQFYGITAKDGGMFINSKHENPDIQTMIDNKLSK